MRPGASNNFCSTLDVFEEEGLMGHTFKTLSHLHISLGVEA